MFARIFFTSLKRLTVLTIFASLSMHVFSATGPVPPSSLPEGGSVTDSDPGAGEQWGREFGRDWTA